MFYKITDVIYKGNRCHSSTEDDITSLLVEGPSTFRNHADVLPYLMLEGENVVGRLALIHDHRQPDYVQVSFFEALPSLADVKDIILEQARKNFPLCRKMVIGLNGHLNYGAGMLLNNFDKPPVFGLPYTPEYYPDYFRDYRIKTMVSYRFATEPFFRYYERIQQDGKLNDIAIRTMNRKKLKDEVKIYTYLNNACFQDHPYWADRDAGEDFELFNPFRFLIKEENLLFAEIDGEPVGFMLWYPDFNQLVENKTSLGLRHVLRYHLANPVRTFRFTEIAVLPKFHVSMVSQALILYATRYIMKAGYLFGVGGFIFEENRSSIALAERFIKRTTGLDVEPDTKYAVFECDL